MRDPNDAGTLDLVTGHLLLGYARVSTGEQDLTNQRAELHAAGCCTTPAPCWRASCTSAGPPRPAAST